MGTETADFPANGEDPLSTMLFSITPRPDFSKRIFLTDPPGGGKREMLFLSPFPLHFRENMIT